MCKGVRVHSWRSRPLRQVRRGGKKKNHFSIWRVKLSATRLGGERVHRQRVIAQLLPRRVRAIIGGGGGGGWGWRWTADYTYCLWSALYLPEGSFLSPFFLTLEECAHYLFTTASKCEKGKSDPGPPYKLPHLCFLPAARHLAR